MTTIRKTKRGREASLDGGKTWRRLRPIAFTAENAQKIAEGRKTQTRRVMNPQPFGSGEMQKHTHSDVWMWKKPNSGFTQEELHPRWRVGDVLWIQEPWRTLATWDGRTPTDLPRGALIRFEDAAPENFGKLRPARFMPLRFARTFVRVTGVKAERLQDISEDDASDEGVDGWCPFGTCNGKGYLAQHATATEPVECRCADMSLDEIFRHLWDSIHGAGAWERNPWVWCYTFSKI